MGDSEVKTLEKVHLNETVKNYTRGETIEVDQGFIIENLPTDLIHVKVKRSGKMSNLLGFATKSLKEEANRNILFTGLGQSVAKTTWCAEILRRKFKDCCQITRSNFKKIEEVWEPKVPELTQLKVVREIPYIEILISKDTLDPSIPGYQAPNTDGPPIRKNTSRRRTTPRSSGEEIQVDATTNEESQQQPKRNAGPRRPRRPPREYRDAPADQPDSNGDSRSSKGRRPLRKPRHQNPESGDEKNAAAGEEPKVESQPKTEGKATKPKSPRREPPKAKAPPKAEEPDAAPKNEELAPVKKEEVPDSPAKEAPAPTPPIPEQVEAEPPN